MSKLSKSLLIGILLISVLLRLGAAFYLGDRVDDLPGTADQISYHTLAQRLLAGYGFTFGEPWWPATAANAPTAHWSYLYTGFLAAVYALFGPEPLAARLIQAVLVGLLQPYLAYLLGRRVFNHTVGLVSAAITAGYAYFIYYAANLMTEPFYITAILASLYLALRMVYGKEGSPGGDNISPAGSNRLQGPGLAIGLGLCLGTAVLLRQLFLLFIPFLFLWIWRASRGREARRLLVSAALIAAIILPFTVFNYTRFGRFVLLNTNAGFAFFWGNHPVYGTHFEPILPYYMGTYHDLIPPELLSLDEAALDQALLQRGIQFVIDDPVRYLLLSASRIPAYFMFWASSQSSGISNLARVASFGLMWPFMLYGLLLSLLRRSGRPVNPGGPAILLYLFILVYTGVHLLTWALIRYRLPVDAVLVVFAGLAVVDLMGRIPVLRGFVGRFAYPSEPGLESRS